MSLPKKLEKLRDNGADEETQQFIKRSRTETIGSFACIYKDAYKDGFNAACELLLPEIERMREGLIKISNEQFLDDDEKEAWFTAREALKQWQEFTEGE